MGEDGVADLLIPQAAQHGQLEGCDDLSGVVSQEGRAEDVVGLGVATPPRFQMFAESAGTSTGRVGAPANGSWLRQDRPTV